MSAFDETTLLSHEQKIEFAQNLETALNLRVENEKTTWNCSHNYSFAHSRRILDQLGCDVEATERILEFFQDNGGYCDCEIMLNLICAD